MTPVFIWTRIFFKFGILPLVLPIRNPRDGILLTVLADRLLFYHQQSLALNGTAYSRIGRLPEIKKNLWGKEWDTF